MGEGRRLEPVDQSGSGREWPPRCLLRVRVWVGVYVRGRVGVRVRVRGRGRGRVRVRAGVALRAGEQVKQVGV